MPFERNVVTHSTRLIAGALLLAAVTALACNAGDGANLPPAPPISTGTAVVPTLAPPTLTPVPPTPLPSPTPTPFGCLKPNDDMTRVSVGTETLNQRTLAMLAWAQTLYGGDHDMTQAITQGSYTPGYEASFGTHDGGGAVDISVRNLADFSDILYDDIPAMLLSLREAGFAAWLRDIGELGPDSPIHIHAIAVGDPELSPAAQRQLTGPEGYFRGFNGLPEDPPIPDKYGPPILCPWMIEMGYSELRQKP